MRLQRPIAVDLFCGAGGMSVGIERAGFDISLAVDYDGWHVATHKRNFPYGKALCGSVADLTADHIRKALGSNAEIDLIFGGPPCQGFSNMGLRDAQDPRNSLIFHFARIVNTLRPKAFVMENVPSLNTGQTIPLFESLLEQFSKHYELTRPVRVLNSADFGVPQARRRLFILGIRQDVGNRANYPVPAVQFSSPTVADAILDLPNVDNDDRLFGEDLAPYDKIPEDTNVYALVARGLLGLENDFSRPRLYNTGVVSGCLRTRHTPSAVELYQATPPGGTVPGHKLPRLDPRGICPTLRAGATSERGSHTAPRPVHPYKPRVITAREAARLHGYPDWFSFYPAKLHACRQIGNSVCPPVAHAVGLEILQALGIDPKSISRQAIAVEDKFELPNNRPTQHARIPVRTEFPKIVNHIWSKAYDGKRKRLRFAEFGPSEIREAIVATSANLPRVRPERFLYEAGQQRAIRDILALPMSFGFSIAVVDKEKGTGRFQSASLPNSLGAVNGIIVRSSEVNNAFPYTGTASLNSVDDLLCVLESKDLIDSASSGEWSTIEIERNLLGQIDQNPAMISAVTRDTRKIRAVAYASVGTSLPYARLVRILREQRAKSVVVSLGLTASHFGVCGLELDGDSLVERFRRVYKLSSTDQKRGRRKIK